MDVALLASGVAQVKNELDKLDEAIRGEIAHCNELRKRLALAVAANKKMTTEAAKLQLQVYQGEDENSDLEALLDSLRKQLQTAEQGANKQKARTLPCLPAK
jgi:hypothetical protein